MELTIDLVREHFPDDEPFGGTKRDVFKLRRYKEVVDIEVEEYLQRQVEDYVLNMPELKNMAVVNKANSTGACEFREKQIRHYDTSIKQDVITTQISVNWIANIRDKELWFRNKKVYWPTINAKGNLQFTLKNVFSVWMDSPRRPSYDGIVFHPYAPTEVGEQMRKEAEEFHASENGEYEVYNTFRGLPITPISEEEASDTEIQFACRRILNHFAEVLCGGQTDVYLWLMNFLAMRVQFFRRPPVALNVVGNAGSGKSIIFNQLFKSIFGHHHQNFNNLNALLGRFPALRPHMLFCVIDDSPIGTLTDADAMKSLISEKTISIELKGLPFEEFDNNSTIIMCSNNRRGVYAVSGDDRRILSLEAIKIFDSPLEKAEYFDALLEEMNSNNKYGTRAFYTYLLRLDTEQACKDLEARGINPMEAPTTEVSFSQKLRSMTTVDQFFYKSLMEQSFGNVNKPSLSDVFDANVLDLDTVDNTRIPRVALWNAALRFANTKHAKLHENDFFDTIERLFPKSIKDGGRWTLDSDTAQRQWGNVIGDSKKVQSFIITSLEDLKEDFETAYKSKDRIDWEGGDHANYSYDKSNRNTEWEQTVKERYFSVVDFVEDSDEDVDPTDYNEPAFITDKEQQPPKPKEPSEAEIKRSNEEAERLRNEKRELKATYEEMITRGSMLSAGDKKRRDEIYLKLNSAPLVYVQLPEEDEIPDDSYIHGTKKYDGDDDIPF